MAEQHTILEGKVNLYQRGESRHWQCSAYLNGKNHRRSTKEESLSHAKEVAEDWYYELRAALRKGANKIKLEADEEASPAPRKAKKSEKLFKDAAEQFISEYTALNTGVHSPQYLKVHMARVRGHLMSFFGPLSLSEITSAKVKEYRIERMTNSVSGKPPAPSTMHQEIVALRQVLTTAEDHGWLDRLPRLTGRYDKTVKISHRGWFNADEYKTLYEATRLRAQKPPRKRWRWYYEQMHDFVLFMGNTGLRPDEAKRLQFRDVQIVVDDATGETILEIEVRGKRGYGHCKSMPGAVAPFQRLKDRLRPKWAGRRLRLEEMEEAEEKASGEKRKPPQPTDLIFPGEHRDLFNKILEEKGLKFDRDGNRRSAYSLRHTYICMRLINGADIYQVAKNCRTSVEIIEKHYARHLKNTLDAAAINVVRPKKRKNPPQKAHRGITAPSP